MRLFSIFALALASTTAYAGTTMEIAMQTGTPVQLTSTTHSITDALSAAVLRNQGNKRITAYRIGLASVVADKTVKTIGPWMNLPTGLDPGLKTTVPAQALANDWHADRMVFYVAEVKFSDGTRWKPAIRQITRAK